MREFECVVPLPTTSESDPQKQAKPLILRFVHLYAQMALAVAKHEAGRASVSQAHKTCTSFGIKQRND